MWARPSWIPSLRQTSPADATWNRNKLLYKAHLHHRVINRWMMVVLSHYTLRRLAMQQQITETESRKFFGESSIHLKIWRMSTIQLLGRKEWCLRQMEHHAKTSRGEAWQEPEEAQYGQQLGNRGESTEHGGWSSRWGPDHTTCLTYKGMCMCFPLSYMVSSAKMKSSIFAQRRKFHPMDLASHNTKTHCWLKVRSEEKEKIHLSKKYLLSTSHLHHGKRNSQCMPAYKKPHFRGLYVHTHSKISKSGGGRMAGKPVSSQASHLISLTFTYCNGIMTVLL